MFERFFRPNGTPWHRQKTGALFIVLLLSALVASGALIKNWDKVSAATGQIYQGDWSSGTAAGIAGWNYGWSYYESKDANITTLSGPAAISTSRVITPPSNVTPSTNVEGYWTFDETGSTTVLDSSGNGRNGSFSVSETRGIGENTYNTLNSSGDITNAYSNWVRIPANAAFRPANALTVELWYKPTYVYSSTYDILDSSVPGAPGNMGGYVLYHGGNVLGFQHANGDVSSWTTVTTDTVRLQANQWHHIVAVFDGTADTLSLYVNGVLAGQVADTNTIGYVSINTTNPIVVGNAYAAEYYGDPLRPAYGYYDNLVIYSRALPASEISARALQIKNVEKGTLISNIFDVGTTSGWTSFTSSHASIGAATTLNGGITNTDTSITLTDGNRFIAASYFKIENEILYCAGKSGAVFNTCTRGLLGTTAASHSNGVMVNGNLSTLYFSTSSDNSTWSDWTTLSPLSSQGTSLTELSDSRYIKYKIELYGDGISDASYSDVIINYATLFPDAVTNLVAANGNTQAILTWSAPDPGNSAITDYIVEYGATTGWPANAAIFTDGVSATPGATVTGLINETDYSFRVTTVNANGNSGVSNTATVTPTLHCVPTITYPGYGYGINNVVLSGVTGGNTIDNYSSAYDTYTIYAPGSTTTEELRQGYFYSIALGIGSPMDVTAWIDYNDNGNFEAGEQLNTSTNVSTNTTLNFTVPGGAALGNHRLRIVGTYTGFPADACSLTYGEVEDYTISILAPYATPDGVKNLVATGGNAQATLTWTAPNAGTSAITDYIVEYGATTGWPANAAIFTDGVSATPGATITGLINDTDYSFRVIAVNVNGNGEVSNTATITPTLHCVPTVTYPGYGYGINNVLLSGVTGTNTINNPTSLYDSYTRYTQDSPIARPNSITTEDLRQGYFYNINLGIYNNTDATAWIDYNDDGTFDVSEQLSTSINASVNTTLTFTVPGGAALGDHRLRILAQYTGSALNACTGATYAEYEDYTISILAPYPTPDAVTDLVATAGNTQATLTWSASNAGTSAITDYIVEYGATTGWPANAAIFTDGVSATPGATITGLINETNYSFRVTTVNANGNSGVSNTATVSPTLYCTPTITNSAYGLYGITSVGLSDFAGGNTINNSSAGTLDYTNYPPSATTTESLMQGQYYYIQFYLSTSNYASTTAWIDYNQDNIFDAGEKLGENFVTYYSGNFSFQVPITATAGTTKLRIATDSQGATVTACGPSGYGEYEDYQITILTATAGVYKRETEGATAVQEGGYGDTITMTLGTAPTDNVTITVTPDSQLTVGGTPSIQLIFTPLNWNTAQTVNIGAFDDSLTENDPHNGILSFSASSTDTTYNGISIANLTVSVSDNDIAGVTVNVSDGVNVTEGTGTDTYTLVLNTQPTSDVTITTTPFSQVSVNGSTSPVPFTFTSGNWNTPQTVTVAALADYATEGSHTGFITHPVTSTDTYYNGISVSSVTAYITDAVITQGITITESNYLTPASSVTFDGSQLYVHAINSVASGTLSATVTNTTRGDTETLTLTEGNGTNYPLDEFRGSITTGNNTTPITSNNIIEGVNNDVITASFTVTGSASTLENFESYTSTANMQATNDWLDMIYGYSAGAPTASSPSTLEATGPEAGNSSAKWLQKIVDKDGPDNLMGTANDNTTLTANTYLTLTSSIYTSDSMINVDNVSILSETSGTVYIGTDSISFSGVSGNVLTGVSGIDSNYSAGAHLNPVVINIPVINASAFPGTSFKARIDNEIFFCASAGGTLLNTCNRRSNNMTDHTSSTTVYEYDDNPWGMNVYFTPSVSQKFSDRDFTFKFYVDNTANISSTGNNFGWLGGGGTFSDLSIMLLDSDGGSSTVATVPSSSLINGWQTITLNASDFNLSSEAFTYSSVSGMMIFGATGDGTLNGINNNATFKLDDFALSDIVYSDTTIASTSAATTTTIKNAACSSAITGSITTGTICLEVTDANYGTNAGAPDIMEIIVTSSGGDAESINLTETGNTTGIYQSTLTLAEAVITRDDGTLQVAIGDTISQYYPYTYKFVSPTTANTTSTTFGSFIAADTQCPGAGITYSGSACTYLYGSQITETGGNPALEQASPLEFNAINQATYYTGQLTLGDASLSNFPISLSTTTHSSGYGYSYLISEQITPANIAALNFSWHGSNGNVSGKDTKLYLWNGTSNLYEVQPDSLANNTIAVTELETTLSNVSGYLETNRIYLAVMSNTNDLGYNSVDYAELKVGANATQDANRTDSATYAGLASITITESDYSTVATEVILGNPIYVKLNDASLTGTYIQAADITVGSDHETMTLTEGNGTNYPLGEFRGSITTAETTAVTNNGTLQGAASNIVSAKLLQTISIDNFENYTNTADLIDGSDGDSWNQFSSTNFTTLETNNTKYLQKNITTTLSGTVFSSLAQSISSADLSTLSSLLAAEYTPSNNYINVVNSSQFEVPGWFQVIPTSGTTIITKCSAKDNGLNQLQNCTTGIDPAIASGTVWEINTIEVTDIGSMPSGITKLKIDNEWFNCTGNRQIYGNGNPGDPGAFTFCDRAQEGTSIATHTAGAGTHVIADDRNFDGFAGFSTAVGYGTGINMGSNGVQIAVRTNNKAGFDGVTGSTFNTFPPPNIKNFTMIIAMGNDGGGGPTGGVRKEFSANVFTNNTWKFFNIPQSTFEAYFGVADWTTARYFIPAAATGDGTTGNDMVFSVDNLSQLTTTALYTDTVTLAASGPSCGVGAACTGVGVTNSPPVFASATDDSSSNSTPTNNGSTVSFTANATDANGDQYYLIVCDSAGVSAGDNAAPTCTGTQICVSASPQTQGLSTSCTSAAVSTAAETVSWVSYACDKVTGGGACSTVSSSNSPYAVNHRPTIASVSETDTEVSPGTIEPGDTVKLSATLTDSDIDGVQDQVTVVACADGNTFNFSSPGNGTTTSGCSGGIANELCRSTTAIPGAHTCNFPASLTSIPTAHGNYDYEVFAYDSHSFDATESSAQLYAVTDVAPVIDSITLTGDGDSEFNLSVVSPTTNFAFSAAVHDDNGDGDLVSASGKLFDSTATGTNGEGTSSCNDNTASNLNAQQECYTISSCDLSVISLPGTGKLATGTDQNATISCTAPLYFVANPSPTATPTWKGYVSVADGSGSDTDVSTSSHIVMELLALDIKNNLDGGTITLNYPPLDPGQSSSTPLASYVANVGNVPLDTKVKGTDMCTNWASGYGSACNGSSIPVGQQEYSANSVVYGNGIDLTLTDPASVCALNAVPRRIRYDLYTNTTYNIPLYFNIALPATQATGSYTGQNTFTAYTDSTCP